MLILVLCLVVSSLVFLVFIFSLRLKERFKRRKCLAHVFVCLSVLQENPYLALQMDDDDGAASQGYYLQPCDSGLRDSKRYVESPVHSPSSEVPNGVGEGMRYVIRLKTQSVILVHHSTY